jgi:uncharacterized cysteine cluster protein YcgN (CxxCxxCC family)
MECDGCTLCCKLLRIDETNSIPNEVCNYCEENTGCKIYNTRPEPCKIFECAWKQMKNAGDELRPDKCGVLFEKWSDYIMVGATDRYNISPLIMGQINFFNKEGISVLFINHKKKSKTFFLATGHSKEFVKGEINDSPKLHRRYD